MPRARARAARAGPNSVRCENERWVCVACVHLCVLMCAWNVLGMLLCVVVIVFSLYPLEHECPARHHHYTCTSTLVRILLTHLSYVYPVVVSILLQSGTGLSGVSELLYGPRDPASMHPDVSRQRRMQRLRLFFGLEEVRSERQRRRMWREGCGEKEVDVFPLISVVMQVCGGAYGPQTVCHTSPY